jgi:predicted nucleic acid-binding protein
MERAEESPSVVVCDAGPLIHLDEVGWLDLLADFAQVFVPNVVCEEVEKHRPAALQNPGVSFQRVNPSGAVPDELNALAQIFTLHAGEWEALRVAMGIPAGILLSDDTAARMAAQNLRIETHGTIGILIRAIRRKQRTKEEVLSVLRSLPECSTLHLKRSLLDQVMSMVEGDA